MQQLRLEGITKKYNSNIILDNIFYRVESGITGILGENGAGKTTLLKIISGLSTPENGKIYYDKKKVNPDSKFWKSKIGYLPQFPGLYPSMTPVSYLDYLLLLSGWKNREQRKKRIDEIIDILNLTDNKDKHIGQLSGGMRQRVAIAQALIHDPEIILLDEPTNNIDEQERKNIHNYLIEISKSKIILYIGHIVNELTSICSNVLVLDEGKIKFEGKPKKLIETQKDLLIESTIRKDDFNISENNNSKILTIIPNGENYFVRYDKRLINFPNGNYVEPTVTEAYQLLLNTKYLVKEK